MDGPGAGGVFGILCRVRVELYRGLGGYGVIFGIAEMAGCADEAVVAADVGKERESFVLEEGDSCGLDCGAGLIEGFCGVGLLGLGGRGEEGR